MDEALARGGGAGGLKSRLMTCSYGTTLEGRAFKGTVLVAGMATAA